MKGTTKKYSQHAPPEQHRPHNPRTARPEKRIARKARARDRHRAALHERHRERPAERIAGDNRETRRILRDKRKRTCPENRAGRHAAPHHRLAQGLPLRTRSRRRRGPRKPRLPFGSCRCERRRARHLLVPADARTPRAERRDDLRRSRRVHRLQYHRVAAVYGRESTDNFE